MKGGKIEGLGTRRGGTHTRKQISGSLLFYIIVLIRINVCINKGLPIVLMLDMLSLLNYA